MVNPGSPHHEIQRLALEEGDILVLRSDVEWTGQQLQAMDMKIRELLPDWKGFLITMALDQSLEKIPKKLAFELYLQLKAIFEEGSDDGPSGRGSDPEGGAARNDEGAGPAAEDGAAPPGDADGDPGSG